MQKNFLTISNLQLMFWAGILTISQVFFTCLQGTAKKWFQQLDSHTSSNIEEIFSAFLLRFKPLGPDRSRKTCFLGLKQMPQENSQKRAQH